MRSTDFRFTSRDGLQIACTHWHSRGPIRGVVQIAHGMGEHIGRYRDTIEAFLDAGLTVYGNDHRGHGRTAPSRSRLGDLGAGGFDLLVDDMVLLSLIARKENPHLPLFLLGHGMGSFAAQQYALDHSRDIDGLILSGSGALDSLARLAASAPAGKNVLNEAFEPAHTPVDWLSGDPAVVDAFLDDPFCFATMLQPHSMASFLAAREVLSDPARLRRIRHDLPLYLFSGSEDPVGEQLAGVLILIGRYSSAGLYDIQQDFYPGGRHEMLNETNGEEVRERLLRWITARLHEPRFETSVPGWSMRRAS
jgi:alpha-beta hydrolase superfamily lysophospholipase